MDVFAEFPKVVDWLNSLSFYFTESYVSHTLFKKLFVFNTSIKALIMSELIKSLSA